MHRIDNCYRALGLKPGCSEEEVRKAYKALVLKYHPDRGAGGNSARFREVQEAYEKLTNSGKSESEANTATATKWPTDQPIIDFESDWLSESHLEQLAGDLFGWRERRAARSHGGVLEVFLTVEEAQQGVQIPLDLPVVRRCRECGGRGFFLHFICPACGGNGMQQFSRTITLNVPPHTVGFSAKELILEGGLRVVLRADG